MSVLRIASTRATSTLRPRHVAVACLLCAHRTRTTSTAAPVCRLVSPWNDQDAPLKSSKPRVSLDRSSDATHFEWPLKMILAHLIEPSAYPLVVARLKDDSPSTLIGCNQDEELGCDASSSNCQIEERSPAESVTASAVDRHQQHCCYNGRY